MDFREFLLIQHARTHSAGIAPSDLPLADMLLEGISDDQLRRRPAPALNPIAWTVWHMARCEDVTMNLIVAEGQQVLDAGEWPDRMQVARRDIGTGMSEAEVTELCTRVVIAELRAYRTAVARRTRDILQALDPASLDTIVDAPHIERVVAAGAFGPNAAWLAGFWQDRPREYFLSFTVLGHSYTMLGEIAVVRGLLGVQGM